MPLLSKAKAANPISQTKTLHSRGENTLRALYYAMRKIVAFGTISLEYIRVIAAPFTDTKISPANRLANIPGSRGTLFIHSPAGLFARSFPYFLH